MKKSLVIILVVASFLLGYSINTITTKKETKKRATSIGGVFFKCKDPEKVRQWYSTHLGLGIDKYGTCFEWRLSTDSSQYGYTQWSPFKETTKYFLPSTKEFMINYRVEDLSWLVKELRKENVQICDSLEDTDYGKFIHILDCEGNKIELWEPKDNQFRKIAQGITR